MLQFPLEAGVQSSWQSPAGPHKLSIGGFTVVEELASAVQVITALECLVRTSSSTLCQQRCGEKIQVRFRNS